MVQAAASRRGYNAKKRNEAAQIAAQNALVPTMMTYAPAGDKGADGTPAPPGGQKLHPELQFARCMSNRYRSEEFPRCVSCTRRWAGDTCRFQGIRFFLKNEKRSIVGISFVESQKPDGPTMNFPVQWNISLKDLHIGRVKVTWIEYPLAKNAIHLAIISLFSSGPLPKPCCPSYFKSVNILQSLKSFGDHEKATSVPRVTLA